MNYVIIQQLLSGDFRTVDLGDSVPVLTSGFGGWQEIERPDDVSITDWNGVAPFRLDLPLLLDGFAHDASVQQDLDWLESLARTKTNDRTPRIKVFGNVPKAHLRWVVEDLTEEADGAIRDSHWGLVRQPLTLHLMEYVPADSIRTKGGKKGAGGPGTVSGGTDSLYNAYLVHHGDTLHKIAAHQLGDWKRWKDIQKINPKLPKDPNRELHAGKKIRLPSK